MIFDHISNIEKYRNLPWLYGALEAMQPTNAESFIPGQIVIDEQTLFLNCNAYTSKPESECFFETHKDYIDVHFMIEGEEIIAHNDMSSLRESKPYIQDDDVSLYKGNIQTQFVLKAGWFVVFMPGEPHLVGLHTANKNVPVKKIVAKVAQHLAA
ncbi:YhcH/YjgK/YiaL family protein [Endozoicomonas ascidiicola]|uniref:YhcH/YjgK/YiaL family protein n=1 Tax=Endozoicomonas ascidiicola TaxID=1698521 RepID=UPI000832E95E|nr:YhcH/YjgK/YiaL family protein [Endozoicomonas ascidiicola]